MLLARDGPALAVQGQARADRHPPQSAVPTVLGPQAPGGDHPRHRLGTELEVTQQRRRGPAARSRRRRHRWSTRTKASARRRHRSGAPRCARVARDGKRAVGRSTCPGWTSRRPRRERPGRLPIRSLRTPGTGLTTTRRSPPSSTTSGACGAMLPGLRRSARRRKPSEASAPAEASRLQTRISPAIASPHLEMLASSPSRPVNS